MLNLMLFLLKIFIIGLVFYLLVKNESIPKKFENKISGVILNNELLKDALNNKFFHKTKVNFEKLGINFSIYTVSICICVGIFVSSLAYIFSLIVFKINSVAFIVSIPLVFVMFWLISYFANQKQDRLEKVMNDFFIQLKGAIKINPDITEAFKRIQDSCMEPFNEYLRSFINEVNAGEIPEKSLYKFANKVDIKRFTLFINNLRYCSIYGGDVEKLTNETQKTISEILKQKKKRLKETKSVCMVLYVLIGIDLIIYFNFALGNAEYLNMMKNSSVGNLIVNLNFLSFWFVVWLAEIVRKLEF